MNALRARAESKRVNLRYYADGEHGVALNERTNADDFATLGPGVSPAVYLMHCSLGRLPEKWTTCTTRCSTATARKPR